MHCALGSYECEVLGGMRELLASGAIASMKLEVFDVLLKLQGCSALQLQRLVSQAGFTLYRISEDATSIPDRSAVATQSRQSSPCGPRRQRLLTYFPVSNETLVSLRQAFRRSKGGQNQLLGPSHIDTTTPILP